MGNLGEKYNLTRSKLVFLDVIDDSLQGSVDPRECKVVGKLDTRLLERAMSSHETPKDDVHKRAAAVALHVHGALAANLALARLLVRPANFHNFAEYDAPLTRVISLLMEEGNATVIQVARAVLFVFGVDKERLKGVFSPTLIKKWMASRDARTKASR